MASYAGSVGRKRATPAARASTRILPAGTLSVIAVIIAVKRSSAAVSLPLHRFTVRTGCRSQVQIRRDVFRLRDIRHAFNGNIDAAAATAQCGDKLVSQHRGYPGPNGARSPPCPALQMDGQKNVPNDILHLELPGSMQRTVSVRDCSKKGCHGFEKSMIGGCVPSLRGTHPPCPLVLALIKPHISCRPDCLTTFCET